MSEKLKPCPFCGSEKEPYVEEWQENCLLIPAQLSWEERMKRTFNAPKEFWLQCHQCGYTSEHASTFSEAIEAWNRRANNE